MPYFQGKVYLLIKNPLLVVVSSGKLEYNRVVKLVLKHKTEFFSLCILLITYFLLRLPNLTLQPIFADEAIYIRWAQVMKSEETLRFLPLTDGKTPLFMWTIIPLFSMFNDPLLAGRFLSVISGVFTLLGVYFLTRKVFGKSAALWATLLYTVTPYTIFFDRMALVDSMLAAFTVWIVYFAIKLAQHPKFYLSVILGVLLGGAWLTKTPAYINFFLLPVSFLGFQIKKASKYGLFKLLFCWTVAILIALFLYNLLRISPSFHQLAGRNTDYIFSPGELVGRPLDPFLPHMRDLADWFPKLLSWPVIGFLIFSVAALIKGRNRLGWVILLWAIIPILMLSAFLKTFTTRYILFSIPLLLILAGYGIDRISTLKLKTPKRILTLGLFIIVVIPVFSVDYFLLTNPQQAPLPREARRGYFEEWTAGYGFKEIAKYLVQQKENGTVVVGTEGYFGTLPDGLFIYLDKEEIPIIGSHPTSADILKDSLSDHQVFYVANGNRVPFAHDQFPRMEKVMEFPKAKPPEGKIQESVVLYRLLP